MSGTGGPGAKLQGTLYGSATYKTDPCLAALQRSVPHWQVGSALALASLPVMGEGTRPGSRLSACQPWLSWGSLPQLERGRLLRLPWRLSLGVGDGWPCPTRPCCPRSGSARRSGGGGKTTRPRGGTGRALRSWARTGERPWRPGDRGNRGGRSRRGPCGGAAGTQPHSLGAYLGRGGGGLIEKQIFWGGPCWQGEDG